MYLLCYFIIFFKFIVHMVTEFVNKKIKNKKFYFSKYKISSTGTSFSVTGIDSHI
jgi:hypothetical protein